MIRKYKSGQADQLVLLIVRAEEGYLGTLVSRQQINILKNKKKEF